MVPVLYTNKKKKNLTSILISMISYNVKAYLRLTNSGFRPKSVSVLRRSLSRMIVFSFK